jgi:hypothetical protein
MNPENPYIMPTTQVDLFDENGDPTPESLETKPLSQEELCAEYKKRVGVPPRTSMKLEEILLGIQNPERESARLAEIDRQDDKIEMERTYRR